MFPKVYLLFLVCVNLNVWKSDAKKLPSFIKQCKRNDVQLNTCMRNVLINISPYLGKGIPEMKLPPLDPFRVTKVEFQTGYMQLNFTSCEVFSLQNYEVQDFRMDFPNNELTMKLLHPLVAVRGHYILKGTVMVFALEGSGQAYINLTNIPSLTKLTGTREWKKEKEYLKFNKIDFGESIGGGSVQFDDIFKDNPELTKRTNEVLNENIQELLPDFTPPMMNITSSAVLGFFQGVFNTYSLDELFL